MALKATVCKATLQIADIDRGLYADHALTIARQPSENDERMMIRILAFALNVPADDRDGGLELAKGMQDVEEPELWQKDLTGSIVHWIEVGQPEERRLVKASGRSERVSVYAFSHAAPTGGPASAAASPGPATSRPGASRRSRARSWRSSPQRSMQLQMNGQDGVGLGRTASARCRWRRNGSHDEAAAMRRLRGRRRCSTSGSAPPAARRTARARKIWFAKDAGVRRGDRATDSAR